MGSPTFSPSAIVQSLRGSKATPLLPLGFHDVVGTTQNPLSAVALFFVLRGNGLAIKI